MNAICHIDRYIDQPPVWWSGLPHTGQSITFEKLRFIPDGVHDIAAKLSWEMVESCITRTVTFRDCNFEPIGGHFKHAAWLTHGWHATFDNCIFNGPAGMQPSPVGDAAIVLDGDSVGVTIINCKFSGWRTPLLVKGACEGTKFLFNDVIGCIHGPVFAPESGGGEPEVHIIGNHINTTEYGLQLTDRYDVKIAHNNFRAGDYFNETLGRTYYPIVLTRCHTVTMYDNDVAHAGPPDINKPIARLVENGEQIDSTLVITPGMR